MQSEPAREAERLSRLIDSELAHRRGQLEYPDSFDPDFVRRAISHLENLKTTTGAMPADAAGARTTKRPGDI